MELKLIFLIILAVVSAVYLVLLFFKHGILQSILKGCLVPLILAVYLSGAGNILVFAVLALVFGWIGDILLLKINNLLRFRLGLAGFLTGHICYIIAFSSFILPPNSFVLIISVIIAAVLGVIIFKVIRPDKEMKIPVTAYETVILLMAVCALQVFVIQGGVFGILAFAGSVCFVVSDTVLAYDTFRKKTKLGFFIVMVTYIAAQLLIILGFSAV